MAKQFLAQVFNWKGAYQATARAVEGGEQAAQTFLSAGIDRWSREGRLAPSEAKELNTYLASDEVSGALRHLGAHLVLTAILRFPLGSLFRLAWTASFWARAQLAWFRRWREPRWHRYGRTQPNGSYPRGRAGCPRKSRDYPPTGPD